MIERVTEFVKKFLEKTENKKDVYVVSHFDTDGITSASIFGKCLKTLDIKFSFKIVKSLDKEFIQSLPKTKIIVFLDLGSGSLHDISQLKNDVFIIDHHEIPEGTKLPENIELLNHHQFHSVEEMSSSCTTYLVVKELLVSEIQQEY